MSFLKLHNFLNLRNYTILSKCNYSLEKLSERSIIRVSGTEVKIFLQGLITNDINHLERGSNGIFTMFLNKAGRVLYDTLIYKTNDINCYLIECDDKIVNDLKKHLSMFKIRRKISIDIDKDYKIWAAYKTDRNDCNHLKMIKPMNSENILWSIDPRLKSFGFRIVTNTQMESETIKTLFSEINFKIENEFDYKISRYQLGIGEGIEEIPVGKCFPLESNCDFMHGISFHKGCYIGQELTARTHHTGVVRKRLMPIELSEELDFQNELQIQGNEKSIGILRGVKGKYGIALLRIEQALSTYPMTVNGINCKTNKPEWWPKDAPNKK